MSHNDVAQVGVVTLKDEDSPSKQERKCMCGERGGEGGYRACNRTRTHTYARANVEEF